VVLNDAVEVDITMLPARIVNGEKTQVAALIAPNIKVMEQVSSSSIAAHDTAAVIQNETDITTVQVIEPLWKTEKRTIESAINLCEGNVPKAAAMLDISPSTIYRKKQSWDEMEQV
jgi:two-component system repressor protein LuxO